MDDGACPSIQDLRMTHPLIAGAQDLILFISPETCAFPFLKDDHDFGDSVHILSVSNPLTVDRTALCTVVGD